MWRMVPISSVNPARMAAPTGSACAALFSLTHSTGNVNTTHHTPTVMKESRTPSLASAMPNIAGFVTISTFTRNSSPPPR